MVIFAIVQWFHAQRIADKGYGLFVTIEESKCVHAAKLLRSRLQPPLLNGMKHHFRIGLSAEAMSSRAFKCFAQLLEVEDFSIE